MKKILSTFLATVLLAGALFGAVHTSASENYNEKFERVEYWVNQMFRAPMYEDKNGEITSLDSIYFWAVVVNESEFFFEDPDTIVFNDTEIYGWSVNADSFDAYLDKVIASDILNYNGKFRDCVIKATEEYENELITTGYSNYTFLYDNKTNNYLIKYEGSGGPGYWYQFVGYNEDSDNYSVYCQLSYNDFEDEDGFVPPSTLSKEELDPYNLGIDKIDDQAGLVWYKKYVKTDVAYDGESIKLLGAEVVNSITDENSMVNPPKQITYSLEKGIEIAGDGVFPGGTVITAKTYTSGDIYDKANNALKAIAKDGKIQVIEINANSGGTAVQPSGKVKVTIWLSDYLTADNLKMYYISDDGKKEEIN
ncbi:MAG: hypothetical protein ACI4U6_04935, partial [Acutalibacteraceae bacterium]